MFRCEGGILMKLVVIIEKTRVKDRGEFQDDSSRNVMMKYLILCKVEIPSNFEVMI